MSEEKKIQTYFLTVPVPGTTIRKVESVSGYKCTVVSGDLIFLDRDGDIMRAFSRGTWLDLAKKLT